MLVRSILEVLWARRWIVLTSVGCCLIGGASVVQTSAPRYQATARVILDYIKPDPITGEFISSKMADAYIATQMRTIRDFQVAIPAAEALGLLDSPDVQTAYAAIPGAAPDDFPRWVARRIVANTGVRMVPDTNIIEIAFATNTPDGAKEYVEAIRDSYVQASISAKRMSAEGGAQMLSEQADAERAALGKLEAAKRELEKVHGVMPAMEAARLSELVTAVKPLYVAEAPNLVSGNRLAQVEAQLAEATRTLGPNHPSLKALRATRDAIAIQAQQERAAASQIGQGAAQAERARQAAIDVQKDKVLSQRELALEMRLLDEQIERRRFVYNGLATRIAELRQLSAVTSVNLVPFGEIKAEERPVFPNPYLILGGCAFLGAVLGSMLAIFIEFLGRRARRPQHVVDAIHAPLLGVMPKIESFNAKPAEGRRRRLGLRRGREQAAAA